MSNAIKKIDERNVSLTALIQIDFFKRSLVTGCTHVQ
jgi:hypothetical protein